jgi:GTPase Era involved in 16S rRNA processing
MSYLERIKNHDDALIVAIDADREVSELKANNDWLANCMDQMSNHLLALSDVEVENAELKAYIARLRDIIGGQDRHLLNRVLDETPVQSLVQIKALKENSVPREEIERLIKDLQSDVSNANANEYYKEAEGLERAIEIIEEQILQPKGDSDD